MLVPVSTLLFISDQLRKWPKPSMSMPWKATTIGNWNWKSVDVYLKTRWTGRRMLQLRRNLSDTGGTEGNFPNGIIQSGFDCFFFLFVTKANCLGPYKNGTRSRWPSQSLQPPTEKQQLRWTSCRWENCRDLTGGHFYCTQNWTDANRLHWRWQFCWPWRQPLQTPRTQGSPRYQLQMAKWRN